MLCGKKSRQSISVHRRLDIARNLSHAILRTDEKIHAFTSNYFTFKRYSIEIVLQVVPLSLSTAPRIFELMFSVENQYAYVCFGVSKR